MARYYLIQGESAWVGDGSDINPYRLLDPPDVGQIVLAPAVPDPRPWPVLAAYRDPLATVPTTHREFGDVLDGGLPRRMTRLLENALGLTLAESTPRQIIAELLLLHGREGGSRWRRLNANRRGRYEIWLGERIWNEPAPTATILTETFPTNASSLTGQDLPWVIQGGGFSVVSNRARIPTTGQRDVSVADAALSGSDHAVESDVILPNPFQYATGVTARAITAEQTQYFGAISGISDNARIERVINGSSTSLLTAAQVYEAGTYRVKLEVDGSTITCSVDGVVMVTVTDTAITSGVRGGMRSFPATGNYVEWDNWTAYDLVSSVGADMTMDTASMGLSAPASTVQAGAAADATIATMGLDGGTAALGVGSGITSDTATLGLSAPDMVAASGAGMTADVASLALDGPVIGVSAGAGVTIDPATLNLDAPELVIASGSILTFDAAALALDAPPMQATDQPPPVLLSAYGVYATHHVGTTALAADHRPGVPLTIDVVLHGADPIRAYRTAAPAVIADHQIGRSLVVADHDVASPQIVADHRIRR